MANAATGTSVKIKSPKKYRITIHNTGDDGSDVPVTHNYNMINIPRNKECIIGEGHLNVLNML